MVKFEDRRVKEIEIPVGRLLYDKLKGKKIKVVVKEYVLHSSPNFPTLGIKSLPHNYIFCENE